jgi:hypothetical protein
MSGLIQTVIKKNIFVLEANQYFKKLDFKDKKELLRHNIIVTNMEILYRKQIGIKIPYLELTGSLCTLLEKILHPLSIVFTGL